MWRDTDAAADWEAETAGGREMEKPKWKTERETQTQGEGETEACWERHIRYPSGCKKIKL